MTTASVTESVFESLANQAIEKGFLTINSSGRDEARRLRSRFNVWRRAIAKAAIIEKSERLDKLLVLISSLRARVDGDTFTLYLPGRFSR